jgi:hypothetical protein
VDVMHLGGAPGAAVVAELALPIISPQNLFAGLTRIPTRSLTPTSHADTPSVVDQRGV